MHGRDICKYLQFHVENEIVLLMVSWELPTLPGCSVFIALFGPSSMVAYFKCKNMLPKPPLRGRFCQLLRLSTVFYPQEVFNAGYSLY